MSDPSSGPNPGPPSGAESSGADAARPGGSAADDKAAGPGPVWDPDLDSPTRTVLCPLCNELFSDPKELQTHLSDVHRFGGKKKVRTKVVATNKPGQTHYTRKRETLSFFSGNFAPLLIGILVVIGALFLVYPISWVVSVPVGIAILILSRTGVFRK